MFMSTRHDIPSPHRALTPFHGFYILWPSAPPERNTYIQCYFYHVMEVRQRIAKLKKALSLAYAVKKFHKYLFGRHFTLLTDHKRLVTFGSTKGISQVAACHLTSGKLCSWIMAFLFRRRAQRSSDKLMGYQSCQETAPNCLRCNLIKRKLTMNYVYSSYWKKRQTKLPITA